MANNPLLLMSLDRNDPVPIVELKSRLVLYVLGPPGPATARRVYDLYMAHYGADVTLYRSTAIGDLPKPWTPSARTLFQQQQLPALRQRADWGYLFGSERPSDARSFLFHGFRPATEPGMASLYRFDFEWDFDSEELKSFAAAVLETVECGCGIAGYVLNPDEGEHAGEASDRMYAWAHRYWGAEAQDLESSPAGAFHGIPSVNWLTIVGRDLWAKAPTAAQRARELAHASIEVGGHIVIQTEPRPRLIDRNRREPLGNYSAVAKALLPLQSTDHPPFLGDAWDEDNTKRYLRRFSHPDEV